MKFFVLYGPYWENLKEFKSGRQAKAFFQQINRAGEEGALAMWREGTPCLKWEYLAYTDVYKREYR